MFLFNVSYISQTHYKLELIFVNFQTENTIASQIWSARTRLYNISTNWIHYATPPNYISRSFAVCCTSLDESYINVCLDIPMSNELDMHSINGRDFKGTLVYIYLHIYIYIVLYTKLPNIQVKNYENELYICLQTFYLSIFCEK